MKLRSTTPHGGPNELCAMNMSANVVWWIFDSLVGALVEEGGEMISLLRL